MNLFLLLTAMLSALAGVGRSSFAQPSAAVEANRVAAVAQAVAPAAERRVAARPDGVVALAPKPLDLRFAWGLVRSIAPERRRE